MHMDIEARVRRAEELFHEGYNCSQSVVLAFADLTGVDEALLEKISIGLGGGVGRLREVCGAVSGMAMVAGFICDRCGCGDGSASGGSAGVADNDGSGDGVSVGGVSGDGVSAGSLRIGADGGVSGGGVSAGGVSGDGVSAGSHRTGADGGVSGGGVSVGSLRTDAGARRAEQKKLAYSLVQELAGKFREENGSIVCHDLLNLRVNAAKAARDGKASGVDGAAGAGGVAGSSTGIGVADAVGVSVGVGVSGTEGTSVVDADASGTDGVAGTDGVVVSSAGIGVPDAVGTAGEAVSGGLAGPSAYSPVPQERNEAYYKARPCQKLVGCSARIIAEYIAKNY